MNLEFKEGDHVTITIYSGSSQFEANQIYLIWHRIKKNKILIPLNNTDFHCLIKQVSIEESFDIPYKVTAKGELRYV